MGNLVLSKDKAEILKAWDKISEACEKGEPVEGTVIAKVKGGLSVDIGVKAFLPGSQIDIRPVKNLDKYIGKTMEFKVIKFNKKRGNIVLSRRAILAEERGRMRDDTLTQIQEGMIVKGIVKNRFTSPALQPGQLYFEVCSRHLNKLWPTPPQCQDLTPCHSQRVRYFANAQSLRPDFRSIR